MKGPRLEETLKKAFAGGDGGSAANLHAALPHVREVESVVEKLRALAKGDAE